MATNRRNQKTQDKAVLDFEILGAREFEDGNVSFTLKLGRVAIYNVRVFTGKNGEFLSFPSRCVPAKKRGEKSKWYAHAQILDLTEEESAEIINAVYEHVEKA